MVCVVFVTLLLFHVVLNGALVSVLNSAPSMKNRTRTTPTLSLAEAEMVTCPVTVAPFTGAVVHLRLGDTIEESCDVKPSFINAVTSGHPI